MKTVTFDENDWKIVPIEPTEEMMNAFRCAGTDEYAAMLAAAPAAPAVAPEQSQSMSRHSRAMLLNVLWHHQGGSSEVGQPIRSLLGIEPHARLTDEQLAEAKWIDGQKVSPQDYIAWLLKQLESIEAARLPEPKYYGTQDGDGAQHAVKCAYVEGWNDCRKAMPATAPTMSEAVRDLLAKVPVKPSAITFDKGWELLDELQRIAEIERIDRANAEGSDHV